MISRKKISVIPSISSHPKKHRSERAKTGRKNIVETAVDQTTSTISVADSVPLCRRTLFHAEAGDLRGQLSPGPHCDEARIVHLRLDVGI